MKVLQNTIGVDFLIWETNPNIRMINNTVQLYVEEGIEPGDMIIGQYSATGVSTWKIEKIFEEREGNFPNKTHMIIQAEWSIKPTSFFLNLDCSQTSKSFQNLIFKAQTVS
ncbi:hypothetical protein MH928_17405 [Flavobacterium sp. WW92]|uniref:hypothetical protein n=1 Tax=unclassified Flavobacterium TaxID=196869 RepID=UPI0022255E67|nr:MULTISPECIES: hypothetical protein [unclassified Flavobacterium]WDO13086.1 hypothetical protein MH928_17405 [Flavobacterium sp. WW92]